MTPPGTSGVGGAGDKPALGTITPRRWSDPSAGVVDEGPYTNRYVVAEDVVWGDGVGEFHYRGRPLRSVADAFVVHAPVGGDATDGLIMTLAALARSSGYALVNADVAPGAADPIVSLQRAHALGVPAPRTLLACPGPENVRAVVATVEREFAYPVVVKPRGSTRLHGIVTAVDREQLTSLLLLYGATPLTCLVQEFLPLADREARCLFVGGELHGAYERRRTHGGRAPAGEVTRLAEGAGSLVADSARLLGDGWDLAAVDWFGTATGWTLHSVTPMPNVAPLPEDDRETFHQRLGEVIRARAAA